MAVPQEALAANLGTPLKTFNFRVEIPTLPGGGDNEALKFRCQSSVKPGFSIETIKVEFGNTAGLVYEGRTRKTQSIPLTFVEGEDLKVYAALQAWYQQVLNQGADVRVAMYLYDVGADGADISRTKLIGAFPSSLDDAPRSFDNGNVILNATFAYSDYEIQ